MATLDDTVCGSNGYPLCRRLHAAAPTASCTARASQKVLLMNASSKNRSPPAPAAICNHLILAMKQKQNKTFIS